MNYLTITQIDEEIKIPLLQQDNVEETIATLQHRNMLKKSNFNQQTAGMKFYMENSLNKLKSNFTREYANMTSKRICLIFLSFIGKKIIS